MDYHTIAGRSTVALLAVALGGATPLVAQAAGPSARTGHSHPTKHRSSPHALVRPHALVVSPWIGRAMRVSLTDRSSSRRYLGSIRANGLVSLPTGGMTPGSYTLATVATNPARIVARPVAVRSRTAHTARIRSKASAAAQPIIVNAGRFRSTLNLARTGRAAINGYVWNHTTVHFTSFIVAKTHIMTRTRTGSVARRSAHAGTRPNGKIKIAAGTGYSGSSAGGASGGTPAGTSGPATGGSVAVAPGPASQARQSIGAPSQGQQNQQTQQVQQGQQNQQGQQGQAPAIGGSVAAATPELDSGSLLAIGLGPVVALGLYRRRRSR